MAMTVKIRTALLSVMAVLLVTVFLLFLGTHKYDTPLQNKIVQLDSGWTISRGDEVWQPDNITKTSLGTLNAGDVLKLTTTLPNEQISPAALSFRSILSSVEVFLDGDIIYSFGTDYIANGKMAPKNENFVQLPDDFQGKELTIVLTTSDKDAFSGLSPIKIGIYNDIKNTMIQGNRLPMVIGVYLCHLGFLLVVMAPFLAFSRYHDLSIVFSGLTSLLIGIYILSFNNVFWYLADNPSFYTFAEYITLYLIPAAIMGFIVATGQSSFKHTARALFVLNVLFGIITTLLHITNLVHICNFVTPLHILAMAEGIFVIFSLIHTVIKASNDNDADIVRVRIVSTQILIIGLILFVFCAMIDIVAYNILKFVSIGQAKVEITFTTVGALVFIMSLLLNFFFHCIEFINESTIKTQLEGLAYSDALTGIANRSRCEQALAELSGDYTIISMDLDYLKYTNDNYGHDMGDKLLSGFSEILQNSFTDASLIGRMGGDEFIVILPFVDEERAQRDLACFSDQMEHRNSGSSTLRFSASWGCASSRDKELKSGSPAQKVYLLADQRMYAMKNQHHRQTLGRLYDDLLGKMLEKGGDSDE